MKEMGSLQVRPTNLIIHLVRKVRITHWIHDAMPAPIWRFYWNPTPGAWIRRQGKTYQLEPDRWTLISPGESLETGQDQSCQHCFIHFSLGPGYQLTDSLIASDLLSKSERSTLKSLFATITEPQANAVSTSLQVLEVVSHYLAKVPANRWRQPIHDDRISRVLDVIHDQISVPPDAATLAQLVNLHPKSLGRLFRQIMGSSLHHYGLKYRLDRAIDELAHTRKSVDEVAENTGFSDRYHLTKSLKTHCATTPGKLRKSLT